MTPSELRKIKGLVIDANLLILLVVGSIDTRQIGKHKRLSSYTDTDYQLLVSFIERFKTVFTTPNILTEVSNLIGCETRQQRLELLALQALAADMQEIASESAQTMITYQKTYLKFGLSDTTTLRIAEDNLLVLTDDLNFCAYVQGQGLFALNFNNLRTDYLLR